MMIKQTISTRSYFGINAANFFLAEMVGVVLPFLAVFLKQQQWPYDKIGIVVALGGLGTFFFQAVAGILSDRIINKRFLLASASLLLGVCYGAIPLVTHRVFLIYLCTFFAGVASTFFVPLLASLALSLVGHKKFDHLMGVNQSWNHIGNIAAALMALLMVKVLGIASIFYVVFVISILASCSIFIIDAKELHWTRLEKKALSTESVSSFYKHITKLLRKDTVKILILSVMLFHFANAPIMPLVGLYLKHLGGGNEQVAWVVFVAQVVMVPVSLLAGFYCQHKGRKWVFSIAFIVLPMRIFLYTVTANPKLILAIQLLDGIGAGIYGVVICLICSDLTRGKEGFNTLLGIMQTALAFGAMIGPLTQGFLTRYLGFKATFLVFTCIALLGALVFIVKMPETNESSLVDKQ